MRILVLGEGPNDLGRVAADGTLEQKGVIPILVERILHETSPDLAIEFRVAQWRHIKGHRGTGFDKKLQLASVLPFGRDADAIVGFVDRDGAKNQSRLDQLNLGRRILLDAGKSCAVGVGIEVLEAILLADEVALRGVLHDSSIQCQPAPETLFSGERHAKTLLRKLIVNSPARSESRDWTLNYANIAKCVRLEILEVRCRYGFKPFAEQVRKLLQSK